jgi:hypothetical protein
VGHADGEVVLWDLRKGKIVRRFAGHRGGITSLAFSPSGKMLVSGSRDATALVWDVTGQLAGRQQPNLKQPSRDVNSLWRDLASADAPTAYRAITGFLHIPGKAVPFLKRRLSPVPEIAAAKIAQLLTDLDNRLYAVRTRAKASLEGLGPSVEPHLRKALGRKLSPEVRRQLEAMLTKMERFSGERLRTWRALEALEHLGSQEARALLAQLAKGVRGAWLTEEARSSLKRLSERDKRTGQKVKGKRKK